MRKLCTRQHFIEYLGYNFVEKQCLLARCVWQRFNPDYGLDGFIRTYADSGEMENGMIDFQVKSTDVIKRSRKTGEVVFDLSLRDVESWLGGDNLVILVLYDATTDKGHYLDICDYFQIHRDSLRNVNKFVRVYFPKTNEWSPDAVQLMRRLKNS